MGELSWCTAATEPKCCRARVLHDPARSHGHRSFMAGTCGGCLPGPPLEIVGKKLALGTNCGQGLGSARCPSAARGTPPRGPGAGPSRSPAVPSLPPRHLPGATQDHGHAPEPGHSSAPQEPSPAPLHHRAWGGRWGSSEGQAGSQQKPWCHPCPSLHLF